MANQDFRRMTPGEVIQALEKRIYRLEHGGAGAPNTFRRLTTFAPTDAVPGVVIRAVTTSALQEHDTQVVFGPDGETVLLRITNDGSVHTAGRVNQTVPRFLIHKGGTQTLVDGTLARVEFNDAIYDPFSVFDTGNNWFTVPTGWGGTWAFSASVGMGSLDRVGLLRAQVNTDPAGGTAFNTLHSEATNYKHSTSDLPWAVGLPYTEVELVDGERGVVEAVIDHDANGADALNIATDATTFFFGKWIHD